MRQGWSTGLDKYQYCLQGWYTGRYNTNIANVVSTSAVTVTILPIRPGVQYCPILVMFNIMLYFWLWTLAGHSINSILSNIEQYGPISFLIAYWSILPNILPYCILVDIDQYWSILHNILCIVYYLILSNIAQYCSITLFNIAYWSILFNIEYM